MQFKRLSHPPIQVTQPPAPAQKPTVLLINAALIGCIISLGVLLVLSIQGAAALVPHVAFLLFLAVGLLFLINWCAFYAHKLGVHACTACVNWWVSLPHPEACKVWCDVHMWHAC